MKIERELFKPNNTEEELALIDNIEQFKFLIQISNNSKKIGNKIICKMNRMECKKKFNVTESEYIDNIRFLKKTGFIIKEKRWIVIGTIIKKKDKKVCQWLYYPEWYKL